MRRWRATPEGKAYVKEYRDKYLKTPEGLKKRRAYANAHYDTKFMRARNLRLNYGMTVEEHDAMVQAQRNCCAICEMEGWENPPHWNLHVDHDHKTGFVRGLLCTQCNHAIGKLKDSPALLRKAAEYLEKTRA